MSYYGLPNNPQPSAPPQPQEPEYTKPQPQFQLEAQFQPQQPQQGPYVHNQQAPAPGYFTPSGYNQYAPTFATIPQIQAVTYQQQPSYYIQNLAPTELLLGPQQPQRSRDVFEILLLLACFSLGIVCACGSGDIFWAMWSDSKYKYYLTLHYLTTCGLTQSSTFCTVFFANTAVPISSLNGGSKLENTSWVIHSMYSVATVATLYMLIVRFKLCCSAEQMHLVRQQKSLIGFSFSSAACAIIVRRYVLGKREGKKEGLQNSSSYTCVLLLL
jgi:hypothetical protein